MTLKERLQEAMKDAMRAKSTQRLGVIRLVNAAIKQREVDERITLTDADVIAAIDKMIKQRRESIAQFEAGNRPDLVAVEVAEIEVLKEFMPAPLSEDEIARAIDEAVAAVGASSIKDMGKVMAQLQASLKGRADMGAVSNKIKARLS